VSALRNDRDIYSPSFRSLFDTIPSPTLIVDHDVRIFDMNTAALALFGGNRDAILRQRGGEAFYCLYAKESPDGCGHGESCNNCVIRNSVKEAILGGKPHRKNMKSEMVSDSGVAEIHFLVTATPFPQNREALVLLILEDVSELVQLRGFVPICAWCKKIRNDEHYWESVETYFATRTNIDFSHAICDECRNKHFPDFTEVTSLPPKG